MAQSISRFRSNAFPENVTQFSIGDSISADTMGGPIVSFRKGKPFSVFRCISLRGTPISRNPHYKLIFTLFETNSFMNLRRGANSSQTSFQRNNTEVQIIVSPDNANFIGCWDPEFALTNSLGGVDGPSSGRFAFSLFLLGRGHSYGRQAAA
jgi:hypothetical protein